MDFKIIKIILYPKNRSLSKREVDFDVNKVNVIVGDSQTGKSAIIPIIDYCLGSGKCAIPVGPIREYCEWFGLLVQAGPIQLLLARREPGEQAQTSDMFFDEGKRIKVPDVIQEKNRTNKEVVNRLNQLSKLPSSDFSEDESDAKPYESRPSFKDFLAFCFQPQHIIANPYTLFYKADTVEHRFKLETIFPLALGVINNKTLELKKRLKALEEELRLKRREIEERQKILKAWEVEIKTNYITAIDLGLLREAPMPDDKWVLQDFIVYLRDIPDDIRTSTKLPQIDIGATKKVMDYIDSLREKESEIVEDLYDRRSKLEQIRVFNSTSSSYEGALSTQMKKLEPVSNGWLADKIRESHNCPLCGTEAKSAEKEIKKLISASTKLKLKANIVDKSRDILDKEVTELLKQTDELEDQLNRVRSQLNELSVKHDRLEKRNRNIQNAYRHLGKIEQNLQNLKETELDSSLSKKINQLTSDINDLNARIGTNASNKRLQDALKRISTTINIYKEILKVENFSNPTDLNIKELTLNISSRSGRIDHLWEIGSGSNWMGYHVSTILALQDHFLKLHVDNYVPSFAVFDQPSQAYFPESTRRSSQAVTLRSDDLQRVRAIFEAFSKFSRESKGQCQIIVLEHASNEIWGKIENTFFVEQRRWTSENALIPRSWFK